MADIASTSWSETAGSNTATPPDGWPENMNFSDVNNTARETHAAVKRFWDRINPTVTLGGTATAYTYTPSNASYPTAYNAGELFCAIANTSNSSTSPTINVNSLGARTYKKYVSGSKAALAVGDIPAGQPHYFYPDSTTTDVILFSLPLTGPAGGDLTGTYPNPTIATNAVGYSKLAQAPASTFLGNNATTTSNVTSLTMAQSAAMFTNRTTTVLTSGSGTYTTPTDAKWLRIRMLGGGGGGLGNGTSPGTPSSGGDTTFGTSLLTAGGGSKGSAGNAVGGTATGGDINIPGAKGNDGRTNGTNVGSPPGPSGPFGGAAAAVATGNGGDAGAANSGCGGGAAGGNASNAPGSTGACGAYLEKLITSPSASYAYAVGAGGTGGTAGTGGLSGGNGGSGIIIIEEGYI